jgi:N-acetylmuramoyl-L-alanine amidase-like protein
MWNNFEGLARTRQQTLERINALQWTDWRPQGITLHNTAAPTLEQWAETGPRHDARIRNLQSYYENDKGWHAGPHWFVSRNWINWFSDPLRPGVHSRCFNATRFGIEMVGDYDQEEFNSGDGALVRDNAVFLIAVLNLKFDFDPDDLKFHVECKKDNHDCPGKKVVKAEVISRVRAMMAALKSEPVMSARATVPASSSAGAPGRLRNIPPSEFGREAIPVAPESTGPSAASPSMDAVLSAIMQRIDRLEDRIASDARRFDPGFDPGLASREQTPIPTTWPNAVSRANDVTTSGPTDVAALLERLLPLIERLQAQRATTAGAPGAQQPEQLRKALDLIRTILTPGADGKPLPLGQVNGALGQTIGNLLNGKKTALGLLGAVATPLLTQASTSTALAPVLALLTPAAGLSGFALPIFLGLTAWGVLGKMEKWSQGTAPPPKIPA